MRRVRSCVLACALATAAISAHAATQVVVIGGLGGEPAFEERFVEWSEKIANASATAAGGTEGVHRLSGAAATREAIETRMRTVAGALREGDQFVLVLLGHGPRWQRYRLNHPGPDVTGTRFLTWLDRIPQTVPQLVINATSASGAIAERWARPNRIVITATRSAGERNATRFGGFWAEALTSDEADRDKDGSITAQEAYDFANRKVTDAYKADAAIATEHARISGSEPGRFVVARLGASALFASDRQLSAMRTEQTTIEERLQHPCAEGAASSDDYYTRIEPVLVEMARVGARIDARLAALGAAPAGGAGE